MSPTPTPKPHDPGPSAPGPPTPGPPAPRPPLACMTRRTRKNQRHYRQGTLHCSCIEHCFLFSKFAGAPKRIPKAARSAQPVHTPNWSSTSIRRVQRFLSQGESAVSLDSPVKAEEILSAIKVEVNRLQFRAQKQEARFIDSLDWVESFGILILRLKASRFISVSPIPSPRLLLSFRDIFLLIPMRLQIIQMGFLCSVPLTFRA